LTEKFNLVRISQAGFNLRDARSLCVDFSIHGQNVKKVAEDMHDVIKQTWVCNPFDTGVEDLADDISRTAGLQEHLTEIRNDKTLRCNFLMQPLSAF
jgi:hypothetical protein